MAPMWLMDQCCVLLTRALALCRRGSCVCVVGEWNGDTAEPCFTAALLAGFRLAQRVPLPNWSDSAHELTIWERQPAPGAAGPAAAYAGSAEAVVSAAAKDANGTAHWAQSGAEPGEAAAEAHGSLPLASCAGCRSPAATSSGIIALGAKLLRRCRHCRTVAYCSKACRKAHGKRHRELHAMRMLFSKCKLRFDSGADFEPLQL